MTQKLNPIITLPRRFADREFAGVPLPKPVTVQFDLCGQPSEVAAQCVVSASEGAPGELRLSGLWAVANDHFSDHLIFGWHKVNDDTIKLQLQPQDSGTDDGDEAAGTPGRRSKRQAPPGLAEPQGKLRMGAFGGRVPATADTLREPQLGGHSNKATGGWSPRAQIQQASPGNYLARTTVASSVGGRRGRRKGSRPAATGRGCAKLVRTTTRLYIGVGQVREWLGEVAARTELDVKVTLDDRMLPGSHAADLLYNKGAHYYWITSRTLKRTAMGKWFMGWSHGPDGLVLLLRSPTKDEVAAAIAEGFQAGQDEEDEDDGGGGSVLQAGASARLHGGRPGLRASGDDEQMMEDDDAGPYDDDEMEGDSSGLATTNTSGARRPQGALRSGPGPGPGPGLGAGSLQQHLGPAAGPGGSGGPGVPGGAYERPRTPGSGGAVASRDAPVGVITIHAPPPRGQVTMNLATGVIERSGGAALGNSIAVVRAAVQQQQQQQGRGQASGQQVVQVHAAPTLLRAGAAGVGVFQQPLVTMHASQLLANAGLVAAGASADRVGVAAAAASLLHAQAHAQAQANNQQSAAPLMLPAAVSGLLPPELLPAAVSVRCTLDGVLQPNVYQCEIHLNRRGSCLLYNLPPSVIDGRNQLDWMISDDGCLVVCLGTPSNTASSARRPAGLLAIGHAASDAAAARLQQQQASVERAQLQQQLIVAAAVHQQQQAQQQAQQHQQQAQQQHAQQQQAQQQQQGPRGGMASRPSSGRLDAGGGSGAGGGSRQAGPSSQQHHQLQQAQAMHPPSPRMQQHAPPAAHGGTGHSRPAAAASPAAPAPAALTALPPQPAQLAQPLEAGVAGSSKSSALASAQQAPSGSSPSGAGPSPLITSAPVPMPGAEPKEEEDSAALLVPSQALESVYGRPLMLPQAVLLRLQVDGVVQPQIHFVEATGRPEDSELVLRGVPHEATGGKIVGWRKTVHLSHKILLLCLQRAPGQQLEPGALPSSPLQAAEQPSPDSRSPPAGSSEVPQQPRHPQQQQHLPPPRGPDAAASKRRQTAGPSGPADANSNANAAIVGHGMRPLASKRPPAMAPPAASPRHTTCASPHVHAATQQASPTGGANHIVAEDSGSVPGATMGGAGAGVASVTLHPTTDRAAVALLRVVGAVAGQRPVTAGAAALLQRSSSSGGKRRGDSPDCSEHSLQAYADAAAVAPATNGPQAASGGAGGPSQPARSAAAQLLPRDVAQRGKDAAVKREPSAHQRPPAAVPPQGQQQHAVGAAPQGNDSPSSAAAPPCHQPLQQPRTILGHPGDSGPPVPGADAPGAANAQGLAPSSNQRDGYMQGAAQNADSAAALNAAGAASLSLDHGRSGKPSAAASAVLLQQTGAAAIAAAMAATRPHSSPGDTMVGADAHRAMQQ